VGWTIKIDFLKFYLYLITLMCKLTFMNNLIYGKEVEKRRRTFTAKKSAKIRNKFIPDKNPHFYHYVNLPGVLHCLYSQSFLPNLITFL
jgi:hypothetical protein